MTQKEAVAELVTYDHCFLTPEAVRELGEPFGVYHTIKMRDTRSQFKGLNLGEGYKEGDYAEGLPAHNLAMRICDKLGIEYISQHGIGSQLRMCCKAIEDHLSDKNLNG